MITQEVAPVAGEVPVALETVALETAALETPALEMPSKFSTAELFQFSGMSDSLRDLAVSLASSDVAVPEDALRLMADQYAQVRAELLRMLAEKGDERAHAFIPDLPADQVPSIAWIAVAATQLSRWCDVVHSTPAYLLSQQVAAANAKAVGVKVRETLQEDSPVADLPTANMQLGAYL